MRHIRSFVAAALVAMAGFSVLAHAAPLDEPIPISDMLTAPDAVVVPGPTLDATSEPAFDRTVTFAINEPSGNTAPVPVYRHIDPGRTVTG